MEKSKKNFALGLIFLMATSSVWADNSIYWSNEGDGDIRVGNLAGFSSGPASTVPNLGSEAGPCGIAIDPAAGKIYWTTFNGDQVKRADLDGTDIEVLFTIPGESLCGVALDPVQNIVYWGNFSADKISSGNADGFTVDPTVTDVFTGQDGVSGLAIDLAANRLYWTNQFGGQVRGGDLTSLVVDDLQTGQNNPLGVALDAANNIIYWASLGGGAVRSAPNVVNGAITDLYTLEGGPSGIALDIAQGNIYWTNISGNQVRVGSPLGSGSVPAASLYGPPVSAAEPQAILPAILKIPLGTQIPVIYGTTQVGQQLSCALSEWAPNLESALLFQAPQFFTWQWRLNGNIIPGATFQIFTPTSPGSYTCEAIATNFAGSASQLSLPRRVTICEL